MTFQRCAECASFTLCEDVEKRCVLAEGVRRSPKQVLRPQDWRDHPSKTYHWGAICVVLDRERLRTDYTKARWFKTRAKAADYAPRNFRNFVIADYHGD